VNLIVQVYAKRIPHRLFHNIVTIRAFWKYCSNPYLHVSSCFFDDCL